MLGNVILKCVAFLLLLLLTIKDVFDYIKLTHAQEAESANS